MKRLTSWLQLSAVAFLLLAALLLIRVRESAGRELPPHRNLSEFPVQLAGAQGRDLALDSDVRGALGPGQFLLRNYFAAGKPVTNLFIFYPSQDRNNEIHSPKNCLPGAGWTPVSSGRLQIQRGNQSPVEVNRYIVAKGNDRVLVLYWYQAHGRVMPSELWAKYYFARDAILQNRTDGALIRIVQPFANAAGEAQAERQALAFTQQLLPVLDAYIPI
jgi:EpsI family protein